MDTALPGQPNTPPGAAAPNTEVQPQPQLKSVIITDNGDGTFTVKSSDGKPEPSESDIPIKGIDGACAKAKEILSGGGGGEDLNGIFNAQFPTGPAQEQAEYGSRY